MRVWLFFNIPKAVYINVYTSHMYTKTFTIYTKQLKSIQILVISVKYELLKVLVQQVKVFAT